MWTRSEIKERAKEALRRNYWKIVLVTAILMLLGCETSGYTFQKNVYQNNEGNGTQEIKSGALRTGEKSVITVRERTDSDTVAGQKIGGGASESEKVEISFFEGMFIGFIATVIILIVFLIVFALILVIDIFLINPFCVGGKRFMIKSVEDVAQVKEICYGFDHSYKNIVKVMFQMDLRIFLWALLFIVPGIIKKYEYYMVPYILAENPDMEYQSALQMSRDMMYGNKWKTFVLGLSFILWDILGALTLGIVEVFYVQPYRSLTYAALYCRLQNTPDTGWVGATPYGQSSMNGQGSMNMQGSMNGQNGANGYEDGQQ